MKIERFEELLDQYGWDLASWPDPLRREANVLISKDENAAELLRSLRSVEDLLADDPLPMGKHKAIDDIFAAIDAEETKIAATVSQEVHHPIDDRPKSRAHLTVASSAPTGDGPARKTYPTKPSVSPVNPAIVSDGAQYAGRTKGMLHLLSKGVFSGVGMAVCVLAGFVFGVTLTAQQGHQETAQATELPMIEMIENRFYAIDTEPAVPRSVPSPEIQGAQGQ